MRATPSDGRRGARWRRPRIRRVDVRALGRRFRRRVRRGASISPIGEFAFAAVHSGEVPAVNPELAAVLPIELIGEDVEVGKPQRGKRLTDDDLAAVSEVYTAAWINGQPVNEAVRRAFYLTRDGAAKRISKARAAGLLEGIGPKR